MPVALVTSKATAPYSSVFMKLPRRQFLHLAAGAAALPAVSRLARAQTYPTRPVRLIVAFAAGGPNDIVARLVGQWLTERLGQPFVVENRAGGGSTVGTEVLVRSPPDGHSLLLCSPANTIGASFYEKLSYNFVSDTAPVALVAQGASVMETHPSVPAKTVPEFVAYAKANPGKINMASSGTGGYQHVTGELFKAMTGVNLVHVPYRGAGPALTDLLDGQVQVFFDTLPSSIEHIRAGRLRALAVTTATRSAVLPDTPTIGEFLPGYQSSTWWGVVAPKSVPEQVVARLNAEINAALADTKIAARLSDLGAVPEPISPTAFGTLLADETEKWAKVVKFAGIKPE
jgi:tripartite-type tricarboxylate transporter receptor subunit TctC